MRVVAYFRISCFLLLSGMLWSGCAAPLPAQSADAPAFGLLYTIPEPAVAMAADHLLQVYIVSPTFEVIKYSASGSAQFRFHNNLLGAPGYLDVTNPMNLLVFFPKFNRVQLLDRTLSEVASLDLISLGMIQPAVVGMSRDNHIWVYDAQLFMLKKIDRTGQQLLSSEQLNLVLGQVPNPSQVLEKDQRVYLVDPERGIFEFDQFATYLRTIPIRGVEQVQLIGDQLVYTRDARLFSYDLRIFQEQEVPLPPELKGFDELRLQKKRLFALKDGKVSVYQLP